jgi:transcriptional regulator with XRE-family HTH domain
MNSLPSIDLSVIEQLKKDSGFRQKFFIAESSAKIAQQLINLRKRRTLNQTQLAKKLKTGQPAISRVESADYLNWSFATLRKFAAALDARIRVVIEASEDVLPQYEDVAEQPQELTEPAKKRAASAAS